MVKDDTQVVVDTNIDKDTETTIDSLPILNTSPQSDTTQNPSSDLHTSVTPLTHKICMLTYGCPHNISDSEFMMG